MSFRSEPSGGPGRIILSGSLTIENAGKMREELIRAFQASENVVLVIGKAAVPDISFLQILCSAHRTASIKKKKFEVDWSLAPEVRQVLIAAGYNCDEHPFGATREDRTAAEGVQDE